MNIYPGFRRFDPATDQITSAHWQWPDVPPKPVESMVADSSRAILVKLPGVVHYITVSFSTMENVNGAGALVVPDARSAPAITYLTMSSRGRIELTSEALASASVTYNPATNVWSITPLSPVL